MAQSLSNLVGNLPKPSEAWKKKATSLEVDKVSGNLQSKRPSVAFPAMGALGVPPKSTSTLMGASAPSATAAPVSNRTQQIADITGQANSIQGVLNQRKASEMQTTAPMSGVGASVPVPNNGPQPMGNNFAGILNSLLGATKPTGEQERTRKEMERIAAGNTAIGNNAAALSKQYGDEIARVGGLGAGAVAGNLSRGTSVVGSGNAAIASQSASARMNALAAGQDAALKGTAQQLTAQEQQAQAFNPSLQATLTQQQQQLTGLGNAANLAAPTQIQPGSSLVSPVNGDQIAGGLGGWSEYTTAQQAQSLIEQYPDAGIQYNPSLSAQQNLQAIQQALGNSPTYQRGTYGAAGASSYIGAQQLAAAGDLTGKVAQLQTQGGAADANFNLMLDILKRGGINDFKQPVLNQLQQGITRGLTSNADLVAFRSGLQTVRSQYAAILGGGTPTDATQAMAAEKIPDTVSLAALQEVEKTMKTMIGNTVASYNKQIQSYSNQGGQGGGGLTWESLLD